MNDRRTSVEISRESYLDLLMRGNRAGYIRLAVDERLERVRNSLEVLRQGRSDHEIEVLIDAADLPWARAGHETDLPNLSPVEQGALALLWAEGEATGLKAEALLSAIDSGRAA